MSEEKKQKSNIALKEEEILSFWKENEIFEKTLKKEASKGEFIFYDGPPFATGLPHYGHLLASTIKDAIPRYKTMRGYHVPRKWGWDCHGLPLENKIEEELGLSNKQEIEEYGIEKFNEAASNAVLRYTEEWKKIIDRVGRFVDMENSYRTMDTDYTESVWWVFKTLFDKGLVYEGYKSMHICPRCGTTLSNFEVTQGYAETEDVAVYVKFHLSEGDDTYLLAWTTTPWTLPGNMSLAVNKNLVYVKISIDKYIGAFILAKDLLEEVVGDYRYDILEEFSGEELVGLSYEPLFKYYTNADFSNKGRAWKIYHGDFVSTNEGTGIVHIAPAFGEDDLNLAKEEGIPVVHHVDEKGLFKPEVEDFAGLSVKPKEDPAQTDQKVVKFLSAQRSIFKKELFKHSYPFCWRCDTPLLNYAAGSWFVQTTAIRDKMVSLNENIKWVPEEIGAGRFGNWLKGVRDWAISRSRYWGAPLPVWKDPDSGELTVIASVEEIKQNVKTSGNSYKLMRHGQAESNEQGVLSTVIENEDSLIQEGKKQAKASAEKLKEVGIDLIIASPFKRTSETADIVAKTVGLSDDQVLEDSRLVEINAGELDGAPVQKYREYFSSFEERFTKRPPEGESLNDVKKRAGEFLYDIDSMYEDRNILIIAHDSVLWALTSAARGLNKDQTADLRDENGGHFYDLASFADLDFTPIPHNRDYELDLHKPYIDEVSLVNKKGKILERVPEVFDCWFESGAMPYAGWHYPYENLEQFNPDQLKGFPADFIAEGVDQTRGWFYSLLALSTGLFGNSAYNNVIVNGLTLGEDGKKMSKKLNNYPEPGYIMDAYGVDSFRYYILSSPLMRAEDYSVSEEGIKEVYKKILNRLGNVLSFYELYNNDEIFSGMNFTKEDLDSSGLLKKERACYYLPNILDRWIFSKLYDLIYVVQKAMDNYELDKAARPIGDFIDDLSTWYLRRSRGRFKGEDEEDKGNALWATRIVLKELSKVMAPFTPFFAENIYSRVKDKDEPESVHLCNWPTDEGKDGAGFLKIYDPDLIDHMREAREIVSGGLEARSEAGIRVRQPLHTLHVKSNSNLKDFSDLVLLIKDEVNVKEVKFGADVSDEVQLDTKITESLKEEGIVRDIIRKIQDVRKQKGLSPLEKIDLIVDTDEFGRKIFENEDYLRNIKQTALIKEIKFSSLDKDCEYLELNGLYFSFKLE